MKTIAVAMLMFGIVASPVQAGEYLQTLKEGCWVCETPQAYDLAIAEETPHRIASRNYVEGSF